MPIRTIDGAAAWAGLAGGDEQKWPDISARFASQPFVVEHQPGFELDMASRFFCLGSCFAPSLQERGYRNSPPSPQALGEKLGLIEAARGSPRGVERNGDEERLAAERSIERGRSRNERGDPGRQVSVPLVLEGAHDRVERRFVGGAGKNEPIGAVPRAGTLPHRGGFGADIDPGALQRVCQSRRDSG